MKIREKSGMKSSSRKRAVLATGVLATFQFLHAFDPASSFVVQIAQSLGLTNREYYAVAAPFRAWLLLPATLAAGLSFELCGYRTSLVLLGVMLVVKSALEAAAVLVNGGHDTSLALFKAASAVGSFSYSGGFIVNCGMFSLLPTAYYQAASSANSIAMMAGSLVSSFAGQGLVALLPQIGQTLYVTLGLSALSVLLVLVCSCARVLPPLPSVLTVREWAQRVWRRTKHYHSSSDVLEWASFNAVVLATHTLVKGMWKSLFADIDPQAGKLNNGLINGITCGAAALAMVVLSLLPRATARIARAVLCVYPLASAAIFVGMAYATTILRGTVLLVVYNATCECALVMSSVMMAKAMQDADRAEEQADEPTRPLVSSNVQQKEDGGEDEEGDGVARRKKLVDFALVFTLNSIVSILVQDAFNLVAVQVLNLNSREWFVGFAALASALGSCVIASSLVKACCGPR